MFAAFFIDRSEFAFVIAIITSLAGAIGLFEEIPGNRAVHGKSCRLLPLLFASGAGTESRRVSGTTTFRGMLAAAGPGDSFRRSTLCFKKCAKGQNTPTINN